MALGLTGVWLALENFPVDNPVERFELVFDRLDVLVVSHMSRVSYPHT